MTLGPKMRGWCLALCVLMAPVVRGDVLLEGSDPVDRGTGTIVGSKIQWTSCDGQHKVVERPPYSFYKREGDCKNLGPMNVSTPPPDVFGLTCHRAEFVPGAESCKVIDEKLAQHFFKKTVHDGAHVILEKADSGKISLTHDDEQTDIHTRKWRDIFDMPSSNK
jgi:hypothetical protein